MLFCPECGADRRAVAPIAPCPACGALIGEAHGSVDTGARDTGTPAPLAAPRPRPEHEHGGRGESVRTASERDLPGQPAHIPIVPQVGNIVVGAMLAILATWLLLSWIPSKKPWTTAELAEIASRVVTQLEFSKLDEWRLKPEMYRPAYAAALALLALGLTMASRGATWRDRKEVTCRRGHGRVIGKKAVFGVECPSGRHLAEVNGVAIMGALLMVLVTAIGVAIVVQHDGGAQPPTPAVSRPEGTPARSAATPARTAPSAPARTATSAPTPATPRSASRPVIDQTFTLDEGEYMTFKLPAGRFRATPTRPGST